MSRREANLALAILTVINFLNYIDRYVLAAVFEPIKRELHFSDAQLGSLAAFLLKLNPRNAQALASAPQFAVEGAMVYQQNGCYACHQVNGVGMKLGPALDNLSARRSRQWVEEHFADPKKLSPGSTMPPYRFSAQELDRITSYLMSLKGS